MKNSITIKLHTQGTDGEWKTYKRKAIPAGTLDPFSGSGEVVYKGEKIGVRFSEDDRMWHASFSQ